MTQNNLKSRIGKLTSQKRRGVAEVISTLLLVVITVVGAVILTTFIDESFVSGSLAVTSGSDSSIKTIRLLGYDTRNGDGLMDPGYLIDNTNFPAVSGVLSRGDTSTFSEKTPPNGGSDFMVIQIENRGLNSIFLKDVVLDGVEHFWDLDTVNKPLNPGAPDSTSGDFPSDGFFSILPGNGSTTQTTSEVKGGQTVNLLIKLHSDPTIPDIELSKTMRVQVNIGASSLSDFLIESGDAR